MTEPHKINSLSSLNATFRYKVEALLKQMEFIGYDPVVFEALRTPERQKWLYGVGRTHSLNRKPVTWTLKSNHLTGNAADIISKSKGWNHPKFFARLKVEAKKLGLVVLSVEQCHVEMPK